MPPLPPLCSARASISPPERRTTEISAKLSTRDPNRSTYVIDKCGRFAMHSPATLIVSNELGQFRHAWPSSPTSCDSPRGNSRHCRSVDAALARALRELLVRRIQLLAVPGCSPEFSSTRPPQLLRTTRHRKSQCNAACQLPSSRGVENLRLQTASPRSHARRRRPPNTGFRSDGGAARRAAASLRRCRPNQSDRRSLRKPAAAGAASHSALFLDHLIRTRIALQIHVSISIHCSGK